MILGAFVILYAIVVVGAPALDHGSSTENIPVDVEDGEIATMRCPSTNHRVQWLRLFRDKPIPVTLCTDSECRSANKDKESPYHFHLTDSVYTLTIYGTTLEHTGDYVLRGFNTHGRYELIDGCSFRVVMYRRNADKEFHAGSKSGETPDSSTSYAERQPDIDADLQFCNLKKDHSDIKFAIYTFAGLSFLYLVIANLGKIKRTCANGFNWFRKILNDEESKYGIKRRGFLASAAKVVNPRPPPGSPIVDDKTKTIEDDKDHVHPDTNITDESFGGYQELEPENNIGSIGPNSSLLETPNQGYSQPSTTENQTEADPDNEDNVISLTEFEIVVHAGENLATQ